MHIQVSNDKLGHRSLMRWIGQADTSLIVFEAVRKRRLQRQSVYVKTVAKIQAALDLWRGKRFDRSRITIASPPVTGCV